MKKQYINPQTEIVTVAAQQLLAGTQLPVGEAGSADDAESRDGGSFWDDDEY